MMHSLMPGMLAAPFRAQLSDDPTQILRLAREASTRGGTALATLVAINGGAARALGSHVAVAEDGRFCDYVSGGCVEAAVASEALIAIAEGKDRAVVFGAGSPFFDIVLPCGGGITVAIHVLSDITAIDKAMGCRGRREPAAMRYSPARQLLVTEVPPPVGSVWTDDDFMSVYRPQTRLVISGASLEAHTTEALAAACGYDVTVRGQGEGGRVAADIIDPFTAVVLLHHDLDVEAAILEAALRSPAFYIGALGSTRTHHRRVERLTAMGFRRDDIGRIKASIGIFGPTRDATSLALSVLADIAAERLVTYA